MTHKNTLSTHEAPPRVVMIAVQGPTQSEAQTQASLLELAHLLDGLGATSHQTFVQRRSDPPGPLVLGAGKLEELRAAIEAAKQQEEDEAQGRILLVFDGELSPSQQRNLTREFDVEVLDRTQVILRIFSQRARTRTAQLEIELAEIQYESPRIRDDEALGDKQAGGGGRAAKGHTSVELRKQELRKRVAVLRDELAKADKTQQARRARREQVSRVALVGYTNAGKSSWMRVLTGSDVLVQDALFATLDTTVRALHPPSHPRIVIADTVGFLRNLPNHLLASFRSTLEEALDAQLLAVVIDGSDPEWAAHLDTTTSVLSEVGAGDLPVLHLVNKVDRITPEQRTELARALPDALFVSSRSEADVVTARKRIVEFFDAQLSEAVLRIPFTHAALRAEICANARVLSEHYDEDGGLMRVRAEQAVLERWQGRAREPLRGS